MCQGPINIGGPGSHMPRWKRRKGLVLTPSILLTSCWPSSKRPVLERWEGRFERSFCREDNGNAVKILEKLGVDPSKMPEEIIKDFIIPFADIFSFASSFDFTELPKSLALVLPSPVFMAPQELQEKEERSLVGVTSRGGGSGKTVTLEEFGNDLTKVPKSDGRFKVLPAMRKRRF